MFAPDTMSLPRTGHTRLSQFFFLLVLCICFKHVWQKNYCTVILILRTEERVIVQQIVLFNPHLKKVTLSIIDIFQLIALRPPHPFQSAGQWKGHRENWIQIFKLICPSSFSPLRCIQFKIVVWLGVRDKRANTNFCERTKDIWYSKWICDLKVRLEPDYFLHRGIFREIFSILLNILICFAIHRMMRNKSNPGCPRFSVW